MRTPSFRFEKILWEKRYKFVAGADEVGRGSFAGPIVAGCVIFPQKLLIPKEIHINDSKKLSPKRREIAEIWIKENCLGWGIGQVNTTLINRIGMAKATRMAFRKAISAARSKSGQPIDYLLVDAFFVPYTSGLPVRRRKGSRGRFRKNPRGRQKAIVDGDEKSLTIGAASIIAKAYRDKLMTGLGQKPKFRIYGWGRNKGYGTKEHQAAILKHGKTRYHRKAFVNSFFSSRAR